MYVPKPSGGDFEIVPAGNHLAVCYRFIDLGTQLVEYKGAQKTQRKILISWELPNELLTTGDYAGQPFTMGKKYTWSMSEKANLRKDLESWRGKSFTDDDFEGPNRFNTHKLIGAPCMLSVVHDSRDGNTYANIKAIAALPKGMARPSPITPPVYFSLEKDLFDNAILDGLSDKLKEIIKGSPEYREIVEGVPYSPPKGEPNHLDDEVPF